MFVESDKNKIFSLSLKKKTLTSHNSCCEINRSFAALSKSCTYFCGLKGTKRKRRYYVRIEDRKLVGSKNLGHSFDWLRGPIMGTTARQILFDSLTTIHLSQ